MSVEQVDQPVRWDVAEGVVVVRFDDGKANTLSSRSLGLLNDSLDVDGAHAWCLVGRPGFLCAGYDVGEMQAGGAEALTGAGRAFTLRLWESPLPTVVAITGHALAAGAALALACDVRLIADGAYKIGFPESAKGMPLSRTSTALASARLSPRFVRRALLESETFDPAGAVRSGFADELVPADELEPRAIERAARLAASRSYARNKATLRAVGVQIETERW